MCRPARRVAGLQRAVRASGLTERDNEEISAVIGRVGGTIEAEARIVMMLARSPAPLLQKLTVLLRLAAGDTAPAGSSIGPAQLIATDDGAATSSGRAAR